MKRILLVGEFNRIMENLNETLNEDFQTQICPTESANMKAMLKIAKPDLVIICLGEEYEEEHAIFEILKNGRIQIPVLTIGRKQDYGRYYDYYETEQFDALFRPVMRDDLLRNCEKKLNIVHPSPEEEQAQIEASRPKKTHILVVDDSPLVLRNIKNILEPVYRVSVAGSGEQALKFIAEREPDLILLDYEMPGMDGKETFEKIKEDMYTCKIPVVFLTGVADKNHIYAVLQLEPAGYILKPPARDKLQEVIESVLSKKNEVSKI